MTNPLSNRTFLDRPFSEHLWNLWSTSRALRAAPEPDVIGLALVHASFFVVAQLDEVEKALVVRGRPAESVDGLTRSPWVLGYLFGACAAEIEGAGLDRQNPVARQIILTVHRLALREPDPVVAEELSNAAAGDPLFLEGMAQAAHDHDAIAATGDFGKGLSQRLRKEIAQTA